MPDTTNQEQTINTALGDIRVLRAREDALYLNNNNAAGQHWNSHWRECMCEWMYNGEFVCYMIPPAKLNTAPATTGSLQSIVYSSRV